MSGAQEITGQFGADIDGERLDRALASLLAADHPTLTRSRLKGLIEGGSCRLDGATVKEPSRRVRPGQGFTIVVAPPDVRHVAPQPMALDILHEDEDLIVLDKPAGLVVHPAPGNPDRTLVNALLAHCGPALASIGGTGRPGIVHRLDKDTSGLMVVAKTERALQGLARQFSAHSVDRVYQALVWGLPSPASGEISGAIGRSRADRKKMTVVRSGGKPALTRYRTLRAVGGGRFALIECRLATGRTHQIRVHLTAIGHPLLGDPAYGRAAGQRRSLPQAARILVDGFPRQALDAVRLGFVHPASGEMLVFARDLSSDIRMLLDGLAAL
ncbi:MAG: RluA family pseudouridine synthase [Paracoccaceae bacterium]